MSQDVEAMLVRHLEQVLQIVQAEPARLGNSRLVTIDGPAGAGKTSLARLLQGCATEAITVHMDDLYAGWTGLNTELFTRINQDLLGPLSNDRPAEMARWDWQEDRFAGSIQVEPNPIIILEGVGAGDASIRSWCTQQIWVELDVGIAAERGVARDLRAAGDQDRAAIREGWATWLTHQDSYLADADNREKADLTLAVSPR
jgi:uridine kinase